MIDRVDLVFATSNPHKAKEVAEILNFPWLNVRTLKDIGFTAEIEETGTTLEENAKIKSETIFNIHTSNIFSEDTGLEVYALDMKPGLHTARFAGPSRDADANMKMLLGLLSKHEDRRARFRTALSLIWEEERYLFEGIIEGSIALDKSGNGGFGYDPIFIPEGYNETFAVLPSEIKNQISHRSKAVEQLKNFLTSQSEKPPKRRNSEE